MKADSLRNLIASKVLMAILAVALVFTMMPLTGGIAYADDTEQQDEIVFTITDTNGDKEEYTLSQFKELKNTKDTDKVTYKGEDLAVEGVWVKEILKKYADAGKNNAYVTITTADNYSPGVTSGKTVEYMRNNDYVIAWKVGDSEFNPAGGKDKGYFYLFGTVDGKVERTKWANGFNLSGDAPDPTPVVTVPDLTIRGSAMAKEQSFSIKQLKNDVDIKKYSSLDYPSVNSYGTFETSQVGGVNLIDLINYVGVKPGMKISKVEAIPYKSDGTIDDKYIKTYTGDQIRNTDIYGNKAMFIWEELEEKNRTAGETKPAKVQRTIRGQFSKSDVNRKDWGKDIKAIIVYGEKETTPTTKKTTVAKVDAPKIKTVSKRAKNTMTVQWGAVKNATSYKVAYRKLGGKWSTKTVKKSPLVIKGMKTNGMYQFKVTAVGQGSSKSSAVAYRFYKGLSKVKAKGQKKAIRVTWKKDKRASGYEVIYSTSKNMTKAKTIVVKGANKKSYKIKGLTKGKRYYVKVRPYKNSGGQKYIGLLSGVKSVKVK